MPRNAVNAPLRLFRPYPRKLSCSRHSSVSGRIADVLGHVLVPPNAERLGKPVAARSKREWERRFAREEPLATTLESTDWQGTPVAIRAGA